MARCSGKITMASRKFDCPLAKTCLTVKGTGELLDEPYSVRNRSCDFYVPVPRKRYKKIRISNDDKQYYVLTENNIIVKSVPAHKYFIGKDIKEVYEKFKLVSEFKTIGDVETDVMYEEDLSLLISKNKHIKTLIDKFDLSI